MVVRINDIIYRCVGRGIWVCCGIVHKGDYHKEIKDEMGNILAIQHGERIEWRG